MAAGVAARSGQVDSRGACFPPRRPAWERGRLRRGAGGRADRSAGGSRCAAGPAAHRAPGWRRGFGCSAGRRGVVDLCRKAGWPGHQLVADGPTRGIGCGVGCLARRPPAHVGRFLSGGARSRRISLFIKRRPCRGLSQRAGVIRTQGRRTEPHTRRAPLQVRRTGQAEPVVHLVAAHRRGTRRPGEVAQRAGPRCDGRFRRTEAHPAVCEFPPRGARTSPGTLRADAGTVAWRIAVEAR